MVGKHVEAHILGTGTKSGTSNSFHFTMTGLPTIANTSDNTAVGCAYVYDGSSLVPSLVYLGGLLYFVFTANIADTTVINSFGATFSYETA
jgi:hypothetical protein